MTNFLGDDFFLDTETARRLFREHSEALPIFDYHCHLSPEAIAADEPFTDLAEIWLGGDHYKWRLMRADGVPEELCSGRGDPGEKFLAFARALQGSAGNPLLHWSHLELKRAYWIHDILTPENAASIRARANAIMRERGDSPRRMMERFGVAVVCTTDDPVDSLAAHERIAADPSMKTRVLPAFRPDKIMNCRDGAAWRDYVARLESAADVEIRRYSDILAALDRRHAYFHERGCRISDHALLEPHNAPSDEAELDRIVGKLLRGGEATGEEAAILETAVLKAVAGFNAARGWAMQLHLGALRNVRGRLFASYGPDGGGDGISDLPIIAPLAGLLDDLDRRGNLPRSILYSLDPAKNDALVALAGCFAGAMGSGPEVRGRVQFGAAWWFNDQKEGMERHLATLAGLGLLGPWLGMLTDSRSFLSYPRHEYFRRILCGAVGRWVESGELPDDPAFSVDLVRAISWGNAASWFGIKPPAWATEQAARKA